MKRLTAAILLGLSILADGGWHLVSFIFTEEAMG